MAGHQADAAEDAVLVRNDLEPVRIRSFVARIHREACDTIEAGRAEEIFVDVRGTAGRDAAAALDAAVAANDIVFIKGSLGSGAWCIAAVLLQRLDVEQPTSRKGGSHAA